MKIDDDHMYHGAALIQIAEHPQFTAINSFKVKKKIVPNVYRINESSCVYLKYASKPYGTWKEYQFTFTETQLAELEKLSIANNQIYLALVCIANRQICCITNEELREMIAARQKNYSGVSEAQYTLLVTMPQGKGFRVYLNAPGKKKTILGKELIVSRNAFPDIIFD